MTATQEAPGLTPNIDVPPIRKPAKPLPWPASIYQTAVGKKWVMALTGMAMMGFLVAHLVGNLKVYYGADDFDHYAEALRELLYPILPRTTVLWLLRGGLIAVFALHLHSAYSLTIMNRKAKPVKYSKQEYVAANYAGRTMRWSGIILLAFIAIHIVNFTKPGYVPGHEFSHSPYENLVNSFSNPLVSIIYIVGQIALSFHLFHGAWSMFQSLGVNNPTYNRLRKLFAYGFTATICGLNMTFPVAVLAGIVKL